MNSLWIGVGDVGRHAEDVSLAQKVVVKSQSDVWFCCATKLPTSQSRDLTS